jgi:hypothetical protein
VLSAGSLHFFFKKKFLPSALMVFVSMITMVITRHYVRLIRLDGHLDPASMAVEPQWGVFVLFLLFFVLAIALVWYMFRLFFSNPETST